MGIKVQARILGIYGNRMIESGEKFEIKDTDPIGKWMIVLEPEKVEPKPEKVKRGPKPKTESGLEKPPDDEPDTDDLDSLTE